jgi:hypothetical protein
MAILTAPTITAYQAQAAAGSFLTEHLPDRFCAGRPQLDQTAYVWQVPVLLSYAGLGPVGQVGSIIVSAATEQVMSHTPLTEMKAAALRLYEQNRDAIEAPLL